MPVPILKADNLESVPDLIHGFTTRAGGVSEGTYASLNLGWGTGDEDELVEENYRRLAETLGVSRDRMIGIHQEHGAEAREIQPSDNLEELANNSGDVLVTSAEGIVLTVRTADCFPILLADASHHAAGIVHAGWRGTLAQAIPSAIRKMISLYRTDPSRLKVAVGPGIGLCCFEISHGLGSLFEQEVSLKPAEMKERGGRPYLDLAAVNLRQAVESGVRRENIFLSGLCTKCSEDRFFSYRRDGRESGRSVGFIGWVA